MSIIDENGSLRPPQPPDEYGEYTRGNVGKVGRTMTKWWWSELANDWMPIVTWEDHPDES